MSDHPTLPPLLILLLTASLTRADNYIHNPTNTWEISVLNKGWSAEESATYSFEQGSVLKAGEYLKVIV
jgi:hypothetical protein